MTLFLRTPFLHIKGDLKQQKQQQQQVKQKQKHGGTRQVIERVVFLTYFGVDPRTSFPWTLVHLSIRAVETGVPFQLQVKSMTSIVIVEHVIV